jgi:hypothetical protein
VAAAGGVRHHGSGLASKNSLHNLARKAKMNAPSVPAGNLRAARRLIQYVIDLPVIESPEADIQAA